MREWIDDHLDFVVIGSVVLLLLGCLLGSWWAWDHENTAWQQYAKEHHCVARGTKKGQMVINGNGTMGTTPDQTVFVCDGEEIVIR